MNPAHNFAAPGIGEPRPKSFGRETAPFEKDLQSFSKEIKEHQVKNKIESIQETHVKDLLKLRLNQPQISQPQKGRAGSSVLQESDSLPDYLITESSQVKDKVNDLISLAFSKGIEASAKEANKSGPFILDAFHDALTSKL
ncbi:MAG: hypothetical protein AAB626_02315, partial [Patescibacteria group bacterium]